MDGDMFSRSTGTRSATYDWSSFNWWGLFILAVGILWLGDEMSWFNVKWSMTPPVVLVFAGIMAFLPKRR